MLDCAAFSYFGKPAEVALYLNPSWEDVVSVVARREVDPGYDGDEREHEGGDDQPVRQPIDLGEGGEADFHLLDVLQHVAEPVHVHQEDHLHQGQEEQGPERVALQDRAAIY